MTRKDVINNVLQEDLLTTPHIDVWQDALQILLIMVTT